MAKIRTAKKRTHGVNIGGIYTVYDRVGYWMVRFLNRVKWVARVERVRLDGSVIRPRTSISVPLGELTKVDAKMIKPTDAREAGGVYDKSAIYDASWDGVKVGSLLRNADSSKFLRVYKKRNDGLWVAKYVWGRDGFEGSPTFEIPNRSPYWFPTTQAELDAADEKAGIDRKAIIEKQEAERLKIPDRFPEKLATAHLIAYGRWPMVGEVVRALGKKIRLPDGGGYPMPDVRRAFLEYAEINFAISTGERMEDERFAIPVRPEMNFNRVEKLGEQVSESLLGMKAAIDSKGVPVCSSLVSDALTTIIDRVEKMIEGTKRARNDASDAFGAVRPCFSTAEVLKNCNGVP